MPSPVPLAGSLTPDLALKLVGPSGEPLSDAGSWELLGALQGAGPQAECVALNTPTQIIGPGEVGH